ncbi:MAG: proton-conducting transporter membrane subunit [Gammaproteobacteria bacterium]
MTPLHIALGTSIAAPFAAALVTGLLLLARRQWLGEPMVYRTALAGLLLSLCGNVAVLALFEPGAANGIDVSFGRWISVGDYAIPALLYVDYLAIVFALLGTLMTLLVARFSQTYLHKEAGYARFFVLLGFFATGTQLVAFAGALDVLFAGWETIGICSALFIGYFYERAEPVRSAVRAFATYRICDAGFLVAIVAVHELLGTTSISGLQNAGALAGTAVTMIALMLLFAAFGKSAQLPFSSWLPRAMEGPTPSSALFYGSVSIHVGLYMLLRTAPVLEAAPLARAVGITVGIATAIYAAAIARTHTDAKGALAHATLAQTGLILAEICLGFTTLALVHLVCHALLRSYQYLKAPNTLADTHVFGHPEHAHGERSTFARWFYAQALHRFRLDDRMDALVSPVQWLAERLARWDEAYRGSLTVRVASAERTPGIRLTRQEARSTPDARLVREAAKGRETPAVSDSRGAQP